MSELLTDSEAADFDGNSFIARAMELWRRIKALAVDNPETATWLRMWTPVGGALMGLASTLGKLAVRLRSFENLHDLMPDELREELSEDLRELGDAFPDIADVIFGLSHLDEAAAAIANDEEARSMATTLLALAERAGDRVLKIGVDLVLGQRESPIHPDRVVTFIGRFEALAERVLDQLLAPAFNQAGETND